MAENTRSQHVAAEIRNLVMSGALKLGARLGELALAKRLGVSRTPVREALSVLGAEGLLEYSPNCGYTVRRVTLQDVLDLFEVRATLEAMGARIVAERGLPPEVVAGLRENLREGEVLTAGPTWTVEQEAHWSAVNDKFHGCLLDATRNRALRETVRQTRCFPVLHGIESCPHDATQLRRSYGNREHCQRSLLDHQLIFRAILYREGTRAEHLMREHIYRNREALRRVAEGADEQVAA